MGCCILFQGLFWLRVQTQVFKSPALVTRLFTTCITAHIYNWTAWTRQALVYWHQRLQKEGFALLLNSGSWESARICLEMLTPVAKFIKSLPSLSPHYKHIYMRITHTHTLWAPSHQQNSDETKKYDLAEWLCSHLIILLESPKITNHTLSLKCFVIIF